jgi:valyl-tRNA synthetase
MDKRPDHKEISCKWQSLREHDYVSEPDDRTPYSIICPPPNVTGRLHCGHAYNNTFQDVLIRYKRMKNFNVCWVPGLDHAGLATQTKVEQHLLKQGIRKEDFGREKFIEEVNKWKDEHGTIIIDQLKRLGCSCDWSKMFFTLDPKLCDQVKETFVKMYHDKLIIKGEYIVNWCPLLQTAISDEEVISKEEVIDFYQLKYYFSDSSSNEFLPVCTTRPETIFGDVAIAVNPEDERYKHIIGKNVIVPIVGRIIPVISDPRAIIDFGTGAVKITPAHNKLDFEIGETHNLRIIKIFDKFAKICNTGTEYDGLSRDKAKLKIVDELKANQIIIDQTRKISAVPRCSRTNCIIESRLTEQWFVKMEELIKVAQTMISSNQIELFPEKVINIFNSYCLNMKNWCISRQIWYGHQIPVWYCDNAEHPHINCALDRPEQCFECGSLNLKQDEDVLDTWFSSMLLCHSVWKIEKDFNYWFPTNALITGKDILFFWVLKMIVATGYMKNDVPFKQVYLHGLVRDDQKRKMTKSLGNGIDPIELIDKFGVDPVRFTLMFCSSKDNDIPISDKTFDIGKTFCTKFWNMCRFCEMNGIFNVEEFDISSIEHMSVDDKNVLVNLNQAIMMTERYYDQFEFQKVVQSIYTFTWDQFANNYLEYCKDKLTDLRKIIMKYIIKCIVKLLHPIIPHLSEEIYEKMNYTDLYKAEYPKQIIFSDGN